MQTWGFIMNYNALNDYGLLHWDFGMLTANPATLIAFDVDVKHATNNKFSCKKYYQI